MSSFTTLGSKTNKDLSTQLGHIDLLVGKQDTSLPIQFKFYKSKRVVRLAKFGEVISFSELFYTDATLAEELRILFKRDITSQLLNDFKSILDAISKI